MITRLQVEAKSIIKEITTLAYYMKGGITYNELMQSTPIEREIFAEFLEEKFEESKKQANH